MCCGGEAVDSIAVSKRFDFDLVGTALADKRIAPIVGNSQYIRISPKLTNPANDAHDLAKALESIGFDVIIRTDVGKGEFDHALADFARKAMDADTALFYYAGHGLQNKGKNYFLPIDIEVQDAVDVEYRAIDQDHIYPPHTLRLLPVLWYERQLIA